MSNVTSVNERVVDLEFQKVQEFVLPGLSALCPFVSAIKSGNMINTRDTLTVIIDGIASLCNANHNLNMKRWELIKPELNPPYTWQCKEDIKPSISCFETISWNT